jgi:tRNA(adenine34) deaminase
MKIDERDAVFMTSALDEARAAASAGEVPVGAVVVFGDTIVARASNRMRRDNEATAHAESLAIRAAYLTLGRPRLEGCTLYVTLEPCAMRSCSRALTGSSSAPGTRKPAWRDRSAISSGTRV